jgi:hypothetical protein
MNRECYFKIKLVTLKWSPMQTRVRSDKGFKPNKVRIKQFLKFFFNLISLNVKCYTEEATYVRCILIIINMSEKISKIMKMMSICLSLDGQGEIDLGFKPA